METVTHTSSLPTILLVYAKGAPRRWLRNQLYYLAPHALVLESTTHEQALDLIQTHCQLTTAPQSLLMLLDVSLPDHLPTRLLAALTQFPTAWYQVVTAIAIMAGASVTTATRNWLRARAIVHDQPLTEVALKQLLAHYLPAALV